MSRNPFFVDTIGIVHTPSCTSNCHQGDKPCPTPDACQLPDEWAAMGSWETVKFYAAWLAVPAVVLSIGLLASMLP